MDQVRGKQAGEEGQSVPGSSSRTNWLSGYFDEDSSKQATAESASKAENTSIVSNEVALWETVMEQV